MQYICLDIPKLLWKIDLKNLLMSLKFVTSIAYFQVF